MKTKTINLYTFDELSDGAKEKARDWYRSCLARANEYTFTADGKREVE